MNAALQPTIGPEAENQRLKLELATIQSVLNATQMQLEKAVDENFRLRGEVEALKGRVEPKSAVNPHPKHTGEWGGEGRFAIPNEPGSA